MLGEDGIYPEPKGEEAGTRSNSTWQNLIGIHLNTMVACDFFCKEIRSFWGRRTALCVFFLHLDSRKVRVSPPTYHFNDAWMREQAGNVLMRLEGHDIRLTHLIRDRDAGFSGAFDAIIESAGRFGPVIRSRSDEPPLLA